MNETNPSQLSQEFEQAIQQVIEASHKAVLAAVNEAFSRYSVASPEKAEVPVATTPRSHKRKGRDKGVKKEVVYRSEEEIIKLAEALFAWVEKNPGCPMREIAEALGYTPAELKAPAQRLKRADRIRTIGKRGGTRYYPMAEKASGRRRA